MPTVSSVAGASLAIPYSTSSATPLQLVQVPLQQHAAAIVQKLVQVRLFLTLALQFSERHGCALMFVMLACMVKSLWFLIPVHSLGSINGFHKTKLSLFGCLLLENFHAIHLDSC